MSIMEAEVINMNKVCAKCLNKCKGCHCGKLRHMMQKARDMERKGALTKEDKKLYFDFMRG